MKCNIVGCLVDHDSIIIDENKIWSVYENYSPADKVALLRRWLTLYSGVDSECARDVVERCHSLLREKEL